MARCFVFLLQWVCIRATAIEQLESFIASNGIISTKDLKVTQQGLVMQRDYKDGELAFSVPKEFIVSERTAYQTDLAHFLQTPSYEEQLKKKGRSRIPRHFVLALHVLFHKYSEEDSVWSKWVAALPPQDGAVLWTKKELKVLEEQRIVEMTNDRVVGLKNEYEVFMQPLSKLYPHIFPEEHVTEQEYLWAVSVVSTYGVHLPQLKEKEDALVLIPVPMRFSKTSESEFTQNKRSGAIQFHCARGRQGNEMVASSHGRYNDQLLIDSGYIWDTVHAHTVPLRMWMGSTTTLPKLRRRLLKEAKLNTTQDFLIRYKDLLPEMLLWARISLSPESDLNNATLERLRSPVSVEGETDIHNNLLTSMDKIFSAYDHSVEEDEYTLQHNKNLPPRTRTAITHRKLSKQVLTKNMQMVADHLQDYVNRDRAERTKKEPTKKKKKAPKQDPGQKKKKAPTSKQEL